MRVRVHHVAVAVAMGVNEVGAQQQVGIRQNLARRAVGDDAPLVEDYNAVGDVFHDFDLVCGSDDSLRRTLPVRAGRDLQLCS